MAFIIITGGNKCLSNFITSSYGNFNFNLVSSLLMFLLLNTKTRILTLWSETKWLKTNNIVQNEAL